MGCVNSKPIVKETEPISIYQLEKELFKFNDNIRGYLKRKRNFCLKKSEESQSPAHCTPAADEEKKSGCISPRGIEQKLSQVQCKDRQTSQPGNQTHHECQQIPLSAPMCSGKTDFTSCENKIAVIKSQPIVVCKRRSMIMSAINTSNRIQWKAAFVRLSLPVYLKTVPSSSCRSVQFNIVEATIARSVHSVLEVKPSNQEVESRESSQVAVSDVVLSSENSLQDLEVDWISVLESSHPHSNCHPDEHYTLIRHIGQGSFGQVYLARHNEDQEEEYAIKTIPVQASTYNKSLVMELQVLRTCSHKNILALRDSYFTHEHLYIVTEYVAGVSLYTLGDVNKGVVSEKDIASIMKECLQGLAYLHDCGFIHCDIKSDNILIGKDGKVKLADFGLSIKDTEERPPGFRGTPIYAAPEMANRLPYGREIDIWSLGIVAIELWQGYPPLANVGGSTEQFKTYCQAGYCPMEEERAFNASDDFMDFLYNGALMYSPVDRLTAYQLLRHPFISHADNCQGLPQLVEWALVYDELY